MLAALTVERIALMESVHLRLEPGLAVFTGETGAGKSILLDAIGLLLGQRATTDLVRKGNEAGRVEALFTLPPALAARVGTRLSDWGWPASDELAVVREIHSNGRSTCRINGRLATVQMLRELGALLVQQHGQHEYHGLLQAEEQLRALDLYGRHHDLRAAVRSAYRHWQNLRQNLQELRLGEQERMRRLDMLRYQIDEIEAARLRPGEAEDLRALRQRLQHSERIAAALAAAQQALDGDGRQPGALALLSAAEREVAAAAALVPPLQESVQLLETAQVYIQEAVRSLAQHGAA
ncbi:MAG: AAA family ATPase, partial [Alicyclobacillus sp.]|nr:AAA family ATPase [Alicyclobacillus sp.]